MIRIRRGLDIPLAGAPEQRIEPGPPLRHVALVGDDTVGLRPRLAVKPGDRVRTGQLLFEDRRNAGVRYTAPGCGEVVAVHRGARRRLLSVVVRLEGDDAEEFPAPTGEAAALDRRAVRDLLLASGLWPALRARPFGRVPRPDDAPRPIFVTALDTEPLAPDPAVVLRGAEQDFVRGLQLLARLADGPVRLCRRPGAAVPGDGVPGVEVAEFAGPHPAGLPGTHIHFLDPVGEDRTAWHVGYADVAAMGELFRTGLLPVARVVALAGPAVQRPVLVRTRVGASTDELLEGRLRPGPVRVVSGSVLAGRTAAGPTAFLGRHHRQVAVLRDEATPRFLEWLRPGGDRFSALPVFAGALRRGPFALTTAAGGDPRPIVPIGVYERVLPLDLLPTPLLKALAVGDAERARELGCLELEEEDLALCSFVDPGKNDFGAALRAVLDILEKEP